MQGPSGWRGGETLGQILKLAVVAAALAGGASGARAQAVPAAVQSAEEALAEDAGEYARRHGVAPEEALRRLRAQQDSVVATDSIAREFAGRLAGISIEHRPEWRIVVLLTGKEPVRDRFIAAGEAVVPVLFRTGAAATRAELVRAIAERREAIRAELPGVLGIGADGRSGELVLHVDAAGADPDGTAEVRIEGAAGVPVRIVAVRGRDADAGVEGGGRVEGVEAASGRRQFCTTGFVVGDGARTGVVTAAHCPDDLTYYDPESGGAIPLAFAGGWGARHQDVQLHLSPVPLRPFFYADAAKRRLRSPTGARARASIRAGETVCHRGETTGYSCAEVELTDYAPSGELCGGPCDPSWVTVAGPACRGGDSGGPVFSGTTAFGIFKGSSRRGGTCSFYFFMSTDYLPDGWTLLRGPRSGEGPGTVADFGQ